MCLGFGVLYDKKDAFFRNNCISCAEMVEISNSYVCVYGRESGMEIIHYLFWRALLYSAEYSTEAAAACMSLWAMQGGGRKQLSVFNGVLLKA